MANSITCLDKSIIPAKAFQRIETKVIEYTQTSQSGQWKAEVCAFYDTNPLEFACSYVAVKNIYNERELGLFLTFQALESACLVLFNEQESHIVISDYVGQVHVFDIPNNSAHHTTMNLHRRVTNIRFCCDDLLLVCADVANTVHIFNMISMSLKERKRIQFKSIATISDKSITTEEKTYKFHYSQKIQYTAQKLSSLLLALLNMPPQLDKIITTCVCSTLLCCKI